MERAAAEDARRRAHRSGRPLDGVRRPDVHRGRGGGVRPVHGAGPGRRPRPRARPARVDPPQRVQAHQDRPLTSDDRAGRRGSVRSGHDAARMSASEAIMWAVEKDPALRSDFSNLTILDQVPDVDRLRAQGRAGARRRSRGSAERVVSPPLRIAPPELRTIRRSTSTTTSAASRCPSRGRCATCSTSRPAHRRTPLDRSRPLWEFTLDRGPRRRPRRAAPEGAPHDHRRRRRAEALAQPRRLRARPRADRARHGAGARRRRAERGSCTTRSRTRSTATRRSACCATRSGSRCTRNVDLARSGVGAGAGHRRCTRPACPARVQDARRLAASLRRQVLVTGPARVAAARDPLARPPLRRVHRRPRGRAGRGARARRQHQRRLRHRASPARSACTTSGSAAGRASCGWRWPVSTRDGRRRRAGNQFVPTRVVVPITPKEPRGALRPGARPDRERAPRARARRRRRLRRARRRAADVAARRRCCAARPARSTSRPRTCAAARDLYLGGARIDGELPDGAAHRLRGQRHRAVATAATCSSASTSTRRRSPTPTRSSSACASRSTRCSRSASDAVGVVTGRRGARAGAVDTRRATPRSPGSRQAPVVALRASRR